MVRFLEQLLSIRLLLYVKRISSFRIKKTAHSVILTMYPRPLLQRLLACTETYGFVSSLVWRQERKINKTTKQLINC